MANATVPLVPRDGSLVISDNTGTPLTVTVQYTDGDLKISDIVQGNWEAVVFEDRGVPYSLRASKKKTIKVSFTCHAIMTVGSASPLEAIRKTGTWASAVSMLATAAGGSEIFLVQLVWTGERSDFGASADASFTLKKVRVTASFNEGVPGTFSFEGEAYIFADSDFAIT